MQLPSWMKEYRGLTVDTMPKILRNHKVPLHTAGIMKARIAYGNAFPDLWKYTSTSDLLVYVPGESNFYTLLAVDRNGNITQNGRRGLESFTEGNLGANNLSLSVDHVNVVHLGLLQGDGFMQLSRGELAAGYQMSGEVLKNPLWRVLARHPDAVPSEFAEDSGLLEEYFGVVASKTNKSRNMEIFVDPPLEGNLIVLKTGTISSIGLRSSFVGYLTACSYTLIGVAQGSQV